MKYNIVQKLLHDFCLGNKTIKKSLFEIENILFSKSLPISDNHHVFITSLPRSGTTAILQFIYKTNEFGSLTYKDMPFVLSPNLFAKLFSSKSIPKIERMHEDGLYYDLNTPEAFEEIFFLTFENELDWRNKFERFIQLIMLKTKKKKYLSKNNYNFKRLEKIKEIFPKAKFLIPFRKPLEQAYSIMLQHQNFKNKQNEEPFVMRYTNYLGHFEFGNNHKPWFKPVLYKDSSKLNYWLEQWFLYYNDVFHSNKISNNCLLVSHDQLFKNKNYQKELLKFINISNNINFDFIYKKKIVLEEFDDTLLDKCKLLYNNLEKRKY